MGKSKKIKVVDEKVTELYDQVTKIQTQIIDKILVLKKNHPRAYSPCPHLEVSQNQPLYSADKNYYNQFWKLFLLLKINQQRAEALAIDNQSLQRELDWIQKKLKKYQEMVNYRGPHRQFKLPKQEFECTFEECGKIYQTKQALDLHKKLKHNDEGGIRSGTNYWERIQQQQN